MNKTAAVEAGTTYITRGYDTLMLIALEEQKQTWAEAAEILGISVSTFWKNIRQLSKPNFDTERGQELARRFEDWSKTPVDLLFPPEFYTPELIRARKMGIPKKSISFHKQLGLKSGNDALALQAPLTHKQLTAPVVKKKWKRKKK